MHCGDLFEAEKLSPMNHHDSFVNAATLLALLLVVACTQNKPAPPSSSDVPPVEIMSPGTTPKPELLAATGELAVDAAPAEAVETEDCPGADDGSELVGTPANEWRLEDWVNSEPLTLRGLRGRVVLVRFWTSPGCPHCEKTMPAIQQLTEEFREEPVTFVGAFHGKPPDAYPDMTVPSKVAKSWGVTFPIAMDRDWKTQNAWWQDGGHRHATSSTFVIGKDGTIVHVDPGPVFHPSDDPLEAQQNSGFIAVREAIRTALAR